MQLTSVGSASSPVLVNITTINNSIPRNRYVVYYQIPIFTNQYKPIEDIKQLLITKTVLKFKILDLQMPNNSPIYVSANVIFGTKSQATINFKFSDGQLSLMGTIVNKSTQDGFVFSLIVNEINGYLNFLKFREKYRTIENITRKQQFKLDHRLKITDNQLVFYFSLQQNDKTNYYFTNRQLVIQVEEIYSIQDYESIETLFQQTIDLSKVQTSMTATIEIMKKVKINLMFQLIKNKNLAACEIASLRVFQISPACQSITIGTDKIGELANVSPLLQNKFYDLQFGYLNQNLKQIQSSNIYEHIEKLTKTFPIYPHFKNSKIIDINEAKFLIFSFVNNKQKLEYIKLPFVYLLQGINVVENQNYLLKFFMQFSGEGLNIVQKQSDERRIFEFRLKDIWNIGDICKNEKQFTIKMITPTISYFIPFNSSQVQKNSFRKQSKELSIKSQYSQLSENKYFILTENQNGNSFRLTRTEQLIDFYIVDLLNSSSVTFQICNDTSILLQGTILRQKIVKSGNLIKAILSSSNSLNKVVLVFESNEIKQVNSSLRTYYQFMYKLQFTDNIPCNSIHYDLQLKRLTDNKKYKAKIMPQISDDGISTLHKIQGGFFQATKPDLQLSLIVRKMFYSQQTQNFDNSDVINKKIYVNPSAQHYLQKDCIFIEIKRQGYRAVEFDFYDENIKKRLRLHLEVCMRKLSLFDKDPGRYYIKIPQYLWKLNKFGQKIESITMQTYLSVRKRKGDKITLFPDSPQQYILPHYNYKDGCSITINGEIGYDKIIDAIKLKCDVTNQGIGWMEESQWSLAIVNVESMEFHFLIKYGIDLNAGQLRRNQNSDTSVSSQKTVGKKQQNKQYGKKVDYLGKTMNLSQLNKLKKIRNEQTDQNRILTANFIKRQQKIVTLQRKIQDLNIKIEKAKEANNHNNDTNQLSSKTQSNKSKIMNKQKAAQIAKRKNFYRSICQCGYKNPQYNGFCQECLTKLKKRYQVYFKQFKQKSYQYERICFDKFNAKQKYLKVKNKLKLYKSRLRQGLDIEDNSINDIVRHLEDGDLKRSIQQSKIQLFRLQQQRQRIQSSSKQRMNALQAMIRNEDQQIWLNTGQMQKLNQQLRQLNLKIDNSVSSNK